MAKDPRLFRRLALYSSIVFMLPATILGGLFLGSYADARWGTKPWLTLAGLLLGIVGAFYELFRIIKAGESRGK